MTNSVKKLIISNRRYSEFQAHTSLKGRISSGFLSDPVPYNIRYFCIATYLNKILFKPREEFNTPGENSFLSLLIQIKLDTKMFLLKVHPLTFNILSINN